MDSNILFVNSKFGFWGGVERYIYDTAEILKSNDFECRGLFESRSDRTNGFDEHFVSVDIYDGNLDQIKALKDSGVSTAFIHKISNPKLLRELNENFKTIAFVHDHDYYCLRRHKYFPINRKNCRYSYNPVLCSVCSGLIMKDSSSPVKVKPVDFRSYIDIFRELKKCDAYIVMSDFMRDNLVNNGFDSRKITKIYPVKQPHIISEGSGEGEILYVGQLIRGKGVDLLIEAMRFVRSKCLLRIVGTGNDTDYIKSLIDKYQLGGKVKLVGWCDDVGDCYRDCDLVVVPSRWQEPFGMIGAEAFSYGRPVVGFNVGGIKEWLKDGVNGLITEAGNTRQLAENIDTLLGNPDLRKIMGRNGYEMVKNEYSEEVFVEKFQSLLYKMSEGDNV
ncbi:MAG: glycosyltransferase family 4 protein [Sedimentisphaeraceae bacterium JB056]